MQSLTDILSSRLLSYNQNPEKALKEKSTEYQKKWNEGVRCFQEQINIERKQVGLPPLPFIAIRSKLVALKEVDDLRYFYGQCQAYAKTRDKKTGKWNSFSRIFFGALKVK